MPTLLKRSQGTILAALLMSSLGVPSLHSTTLHAWTQVSDATLKDRIEYQLQTDSTVKKYDIRVKVASGDVTLTGDVATEAQKTEAGKIAKIDGVAKVENDLKVDRAVDDTLAERAKKGMRRTGEAIDDAWITTKVKWFFLGDNLLKGSSISVDTKDRVVTLNGTVKTEAGRARAVALANDTDGVTKVVDRLTIGHQLFK
jgi:osmotically-inducible protein OsmY